jgi:cytoskeletal protein RodZ
MPEIGATLREARTRAKIDVSQVEAATKIRAKYIRAMENEDWELMPGPTFVKSFLRTYSEYLGIDGKLLVEEYKLRHEAPPETELQPIAPRPRDRARDLGLRRPRLSRAWIVGLSALGVLIALIVLGSIGGGGTGTPVATQTTATAPKRPARRTAPAPTRVRLQIVPTGDVYVCLRDAQGNLLVNQTLTPGGAQPQGTYRSRRPVGRSS